MKAELSKIESQRDHAVEALKKQGVALKSDLDRAMQPSDNFTSHVASTLMAAALGGVLLYMQSHQGSKRGKPKTVGAKIKRTLADTARDMGAMIDWEKVAAQAVGLFAEGANRVASKMTKKNGRVH
jgi:hypothetical protein